MNVTLFSNTNDILGINEEIKFTTVHTISAERANIVVSETSSTMLNLSSVRSFITPVSNFLCFLLRIPNLHRMQIGIILNILYKKICIRL